MQRLLLLLLSIPAALAAGCSLDLKLQDQFSDPDAITSSRTARELLASAYNSLPQFQMEFSILSDDFCPTSLVSRAADLNNLYNWQDRAIDDLAESVWTGYYYTVALVNALLPRLDRIAPADEADALRLERIRSEALALKALCYFDLVRLFAPDYSEATAGADAIVLKDRLELDFLPRSSLAACVGAIDELLTRAAATDNSSTEVFYLSSDAVAALRTELALYRGDCEAAVRLGLPLLQDAEERWSPIHYGNLWSADASAERLFAPYIFNSFYTGLCYDKEYGDYFELHDAVTYAEGDVRAAWSVYPKPTSSGLARLLGKYNRMYYENTTVRYINTLRYSGVCFAVAEACARLGRADEARELLDRYLTARGAAPLDENLTGEALVAAVLAEKQKEFVGEGVRLFDLKRLGAPLIRCRVGGAAASTVAADDYRWVFPIPAAEYRYNLQMTQNPGWPKEMPQ